MTDDENRSAIIAAIERLVTCYPRFTLSKATISAYADHLDMFGCEYVARTLDRLARESTFFPSIAEILQVLDPQSAPAPPAKRTGWRFVRGTHGSTFVRDDDGTDQPPTWMQ